METNKAPMFLIKQMIDDLFNKYGYGVFSVYSSFTDTIVIYEISYA